MKDTQECKHTGDKNWGHCADCDKYILPEHKIPKEAFADTQWKFQFDKDFPRENDESLLRFCRLDFPEGDGRSIKSFISKLIESTRKEERALLREKVEELCYYWQMKATNRPLVRLDDVLKLLDNK